MIRKSCIKYLELAMLLGALGLSGCQSNSSAVTQPALTESSNRTAQNSETEDATTDAQEENVQLPADMPSGFVFSSGAGGWSSELELHGDGSFTGSYSDSDMGDTGDDYPNGTMYVCNFLGQFKDIRKTGEHTYEMTLEGLQKEDIEDEIIDGVHKVPSTAYGIEDGKKFTLYTPDTPLSEIPEELEGWDPYRFDEDSDSRTTLGAYALYNEATGDGFFSYTE